MIRSRVWEREFAQVVWADGHPHVLVNIKREDGRLTSKEALELAYALRDAHDHSEVSCKKAVWDR